VDRAVAVALGPRSPESPGTLFVTTRYWAQIMAATLLRMPIVSLTVGWFNQEGDLA
jgi:hypothetical protein